MLVVGPVGAGPARQESLRRGDAFGSCIRIVVGDFVVVPDHDPREHRVGFLQVRIPLVQRMARAILRQRPHLRLPERPHQVLAPGSFVDVVAQVNDEIRFVRQQMAVGGIEPVLMVLAGGDGEAQSGNAGLLVRQGARAADRGCDDRGR